MTCLNVSVRHSRYQAMIGVGGIGSGSFFALHGDHTLGREESRSGHFLNRRDYCKLHIVSHYVQTLLGPAFVTIPVGKVGNDEVGKKLCEEMKMAGLDISHVKFSENAQTLFGICLIYPDGSGCNLTIDNSACAQVSASFVATAKPEFMRFTGRGIALAAPEVPMEARIQLLELATKYKFLRVASFVSAEVEEVIDSGILRSIDLLAVNLDEAASVVRRSMEGERPESIVYAAVEAIQRINRQIQLSITAGINGSWSWDGTSLVHVPAFRTQVVSTAGAGDAHLSGMLAGLTAGLSIAHAQQLATLVAALSITSPHTINKEINRESLSAFAAETQAPLCDAVKSLLDE
jgi:ribokinase